MFCCWGEFLKSQSVDREEIQQHCCRGQAGKEGSTFASANYSTHVFYLKVIASSR